MPAPRTLAELLSPLDMSRLLEAFQAVAPELSLAVAELDGATVALVGDWPPDAIEELRGRTGVGEVRFYTLAEGANLVGMLGVRGAATPINRALEKALHTALTLVIEQTLLTSSQTDLLRSTQTRAIQLEIVMGITRELTTVIDLEKLLMLIMRSAAGILKGMSGSLFLVDDESGDLVFRVVTSGEQNLIGTHVPAGQGIVGQAVVSGQPVMAHDVQGTDQFYADLEHEGFQTRSLLAVPLRVGPRTIGVLEVINKEGGSPFDQDDVSLLTTFAAQAAIAIESARLVAAMLVKQRLEEELRLAFDLQSSLIPQRAPRLEGWEFAGWWQPAKQVGGDFYDFIPHQDGPLGVVVADVSDKGMHAALFMALTRSIIRADTTTDQTPAQSIAAANRLVCADSTGGMFVTLFYARFEPHSRQVTYVNAGQNPPLLARAGSDQLEKLTRTGLMLGFDENAPFGQQTLQLAPGDVILLYTDGVTEAFNASNEEFGERRLREVILTNKSRSADDVLTALKAALAEHIGDTPQSDDITVVVARCT